MDESSPVLLQAMRLVRHSDQAPTEQVHTLDVTCQCHKCHKCRPNLNTTNVVNRYKSSEDSRFTEEGSAEEPSQTKLRDATSLKIERLRDWGKVSNWMWAMWGPKSSPVYFFFWNILEAKKWSKNGNCEKCESNCIELWSPSRLVKPGTFDHTSCMAPCRAWLRAVTDRRRVFSPSLASRSS